MAVGVWAAQAWEYSNFDLGWESTSPFRVGAQSGGLPGLTSLSWRAGVICGQEGLCIATPGIPIVTFLRLGGQLIFPRGSLEKMRLLWMATATTPILLPIVALPRFESRPLPPSNSMGWMWPADLKMPRSELAGFQVAWSPHCWLPQHALYGGALEDHSEISTDLKCGWRNNTDNPQLTNGPLATLQVMMDHWDWYIIQFQSYAIAAHPCSRG